MRTVRLYAQFVVCRKHSDEGWYYQEISVKYCLKLRDRCYGEFLVPVLELAGSLVLDCSRCRVELSKPKSDDLLLNLVDEGAPTGDDGGPFVTSLSALNRFLQIVGLSPDVA